MEAGAPLPEEIPSPAAPQEPQVGEIVKALGRCLSFIAVVDEVRALPPVPRQDEQLGGRQRRRDRGRRKGVQNHPQSEATGEYLWWLSINGGVCVPDQLYGQRMADAINAAVQEGLATNIAQAIEARQALMLKGPLSISDYSRLQQAQGEVTELIAPWVACSTRGLSQAFVGVQRNIPIRFVGEGAHARATALADYVNAVVRPFVDPIQVSLQAQLYARMGENIHIDFMRG